MWWRFYNSGWYDACLVLLFGTAMWLLLVRFAPQVGPAIDSAIASVRAQGIEFQALAALALFGLLIWAGVWQINQLLRIER